MNNLTLVLLCILIFSCLIHIINLVEEIQTNPQAKDGEIGKLFFYTIVIIFTIIVIVMRLLC